MEQNVEQLKQEISEQYLKNFKKELGWLKSIALLPIEKKVKNLITGKADLPEKFDEIEEFGRWKDIISFVSLKTANQIFEFMKQKRLEIEKRNTKEELENLKNEILGIPKKPEHQENSQKQEQKTEQNQQENSESQDQTSVSSQENEDSKLENKQNSTSQKTEEKKDQEPNSMAIGASVGTLGAGGVYALDKLRNGSELKKLSNSLDATTMKTTIERSIAAMEKQKAVLMRANRLSTKQIQTIDKHIKKLTEGLESVDGKTVDIIKLWNQLDGKLPKTLLQRAALDPKTLSKLEKLAPELLGKSDDEIKALLKTKNIKIPDELFQSLKLAKNADEIKGMTKILAHGSKINRFLQTLAGSMVLDVAFFGFDVWMYLETQKEAELIAKVNEVRAQNKKNQATTQLAIGLASVAAEVAIIATAMAGGTAVWGPFGTVAGLAVGAVSAAASMGVDSLYFDVHDFYTQNQEDFLKQSRGELKFAILQWLHNQKQGNVSLNEKVHSSLANLFSVEGKNGKAQSLKDACFSMLFLEEVQLWSFKNDMDLLAYLHSGKKKADFIADLPVEERENFEQKREQISQKINQRLEYINTQLADQTVIKQIQSGKGMQYLTQLFTMSKLYAHQGKEKWKADRSLEENLKTAKSEFFTDFPTAKLQKFEKIKTENPYLFQEMLTTGELDNLLKENEIDQNYVQNVKLLDRYQEWLKLTQSYEEMSALEIPDMNKNVNFIERLLQADFDLEKVEYPNFDVEGAKNIVQSNIERRWITEIADDPMQNVLYQLAKELYGYQGQNTQEELMQFFSSQGELHGFYYENKRKLNEDWAVDQSVEKLDLGEYSEKEIPKLVDKFLNGELKATSFGFCFRLLGIWSDKSVIDTLTESIDHHLQKEWQAKLKALLIKELKFRSKENKQKVKNQISTFVQKNSKDGAYLELPYFLLMQARQAWFGDLQRLLFAWKDGKMQILGMQSELELGANFDAQRSYFTQAREQFTKEEQRYLDRVEQAHHKLEKLRNVEGSQGKEDELDLPREVEILISQKHKERENFKSELLLRDAGTALSLEMQIRYEEFYEYFEALYDGILMQLTEFKLSNDLDSFGYYQTALQRGQQELFEKDGNLKEGESALLKNTQIRKRYQNQLSTFKIWNKSIQELRNSENSKEKLLAKRASQVMIRMILEKGLLTENKNGEIVGIGHGDPKFTITTEDGRMISFLDDSFNQKVQNAIAQLQEEPSLFDAEKALSQLLKPIQIKQLKTEEKETVDYAKALQKQIEQTNADIVWQGKRGNLTYLPEQSALKSRGNQVQFEKQGEKYFLKGEKEHLKIWLTLQELCWLANFRNRCVHKYKGKHIILSKPYRIRKQTLMIDNSRIDTKLIARDDLEKYCPICKDDQAIEKIKIWLNSQL